MLHILSEEAYQTTLATITLGASGITKKASIMWNDGVQRISYVKVYQPNERCKKLCNEAIGCLIASELSLKQPNMFGLVRIPEFVKEQFSEIKDINENRDIWAWVSTECGESVKARFRIKDPDKLSNKLDKIKNDEMIHQSLSFLVKKEGLSDIIAFDDYIANNDRNIGNLVIDNYGSIGIIDHGEILGRIDWFNKIEELCCEQYFNNTLLQIIEHFQNPFPVKSNAVRASAQHAEAFIKSKKTLEYWLKILIQTGTNDLSKQKEFVDGLLSYLEVRSLKATEGFAQRIGLVA